MSLSIRGRLALWYVTVLSLVLAAFGAAFHLVHSRSRVAGVDDDLARVDALVGRFMDEELDEHEQLPEAAHYLQDVDLRGRSLAVFDATGAPLSGPWEALPPPDSQGLREQAHATVGTPAGPFRILWARHRHGDTTYLVGVAESLAPVVRELAGLRHTLLGSFFITLLLAAAGGSWIARAALRPVELMAAQAQRIDGRTPGLRLAPPNPKDELGQLARVFNDLLARLESALSQQRQFMADASHELRTPVSVARTAIEVTLRRAGRHEDEYRDCLNVVAEQMRRLSRIVEDMFTLARADAAGLPLEEGPLYLDELVADCVKEARVLAAPKGVGLDWRGPGDMEARGDERLLRQMLMNLLDNAVRHTATGGWVRLELVGQPEAVELSVTDGGGGVPEDDRERIFERFVRLKAARGPGEGAGLGLPIARAIAEAHGGTLVLARSDSSGSTFRVRLPLPEGGPWEGDRPPAPGGPPSGGASEPRGSQPRVAAPRAAEPGRGAVPSSRTGAGGGT